MSIRNSYGGEIYTIENILSRTLSKSFTGIKGGSESFIRGIKKVKQNVVNKAKTFINRTRHTIGFGLKTASLAPYAVGATLKGIHKGIVITDRHISKLNQISKNVQQNAANLIRHGSKFRNKSNSKLKKIYGSAAVSVGKIIHGIGSSIKILPLITNVSKNISYGTINNIGSFYTKYGDILFKIGNKIDTTKHKNIKEFLK